MSRAQDIWDELVDGNARFVAGTPQRPRQDLARRDDLAGGQQPPTIVFGCADSRVPPELVFDQGLGDVFAVRTAGHIVDGTVLGSLEFGVGALGAELLVVLGHASCGAVKAAVASVESGEMPGGFVRDIVEHVSPSVLQARAAGRTRPAEVEAEHVRATVYLLMDRSAAIRDAVRDGRLAIVGATYALDTGSVTPVTTVGTLTAPA